MQLPEHRVTGNSLATSMWDWFNKLQESRVMEYRAAINTHVVSRGVIIVIGECS